MGRADQLAAFARAVTAGAGGQAQVVWIEGPAGSGKTALLRHALALLPPGAEVLRTGGDEMASHVTGDVLGQIDPRLQATPDPMAAGLDLLRVLAERPGDDLVVLVVEDLHWADATSRHALLHAANRLGDDRVLVVVTTRPPEGPPDGWERLAADPDRCVRIDVGALSVEEVQALAAAAGADLGDDAAARLHRFTGGHALWVRTLLAELSVTELTQGQGDLPAPRSLASTILARVADVPPDGQRLVSALAVLNRRTALTVLAAVAEVEDPTAALDAVVAADLVTWWPSEPGTPVALTHPLHRVAIYHDLAPTTRRDLHLAAARQLGPPEALAHRVAAADRADAALAADLHAAARDETARGDAVSTSRHLLWAAAVDPDTEAGDRAAADAVIALAGANGRNHTAHLRDQLAARPVTARRDLALGMIALADGDGSQAESLLEHAVATADDDAELAFVALVARASAAATLGQPQQAIDAATRALAIDPEAIDPRVYAANEQLAWNGRSFGTMQRDGAAAALADLHQRLPQPAPLVPGTDVELLVSRGSLAFYAGRNTAVAEDLRAVIDLSRAGSMPRQLARTHLHLSQAEYYLGRWDESLVHGRVARSLAGDGGDVWLEGQAHAILATVLGSRADADGARRHLTAARAAADRLQTPELVFTASIAEAALARALGDHAGVVAAIEPLVAFGPEFIPMATTLSWWPMLISAVTDQGDLDRAELWVGQLEVEAERRSLPMASRARALRARIAVARNAPDEAAAGFTEAIERLVPDDPFLERTLLHHDFGRLLLARGARRDAVDQLRVARDRFADVAAPSYLAKVDQDLAGAGLRLADGSGKGGIELTEREQDVVALVRKGMTNREVAEALYVSAKAVEYHLGNVYGKLGIRSRRDLRDATTVSGDRSRDTP